MSIRILWNTLEGPPLLAVTTGGTAMSALMLAQTCFLGAWLPANGPSITRAAGIAAPRFVIRMGIGDGAIRLDIRRTEDIAGQTEQLRCHPPPPQESAWLSAPRSIESDQWYGSRPDGRRERKKSSGNMPATLENTGFPVL